MPKKPEPIVLMEKTVLVKMKRCSQCSNYKELAEYDSYKNAPNKLRAYCKECRRKYMKEYRLKQRNKNA